VISEPQKAIDDLQRSFDTQQQTIGTQLTVINDQIKAIGEPQKAIDDLQRSFDTQQQTIGTQLTEINDQIKKISDDQAGAGVSTPVDNTQAQRVPITMEIINAVKTHGLDPGKLYYYLSSPLVLATNNQNYAGDINAEGVLILRESNTSSKIEISTAEKGTFGSYSPEGKAKFEINFSLTNPVKTVKLTFERNEQKNSFDFAYAEDAGKTYILSKGDPVPQLFILYNYIIENQNAIVAVQGIPPAQTTDTEKTPDPQKDIPPVVIINAQVHQGNLRTTVSAPAHTPVYTSSKNIIGAGTLTTNVVVAYIRRNNPNVSTRYAENLIDTYISEAKRENINWDIAIAQICYATDYLRNQQLINARNYAGFSAINGAPVRYDTVVPGVDRSVDIGVRAHIQHLKGYATTVRPQGTIVDKRYEMLGAIKGTVKTLDALFGVWSPYNAKNYGDGINSILRGLYGS
jgi:hypothetical protein